MVLLLAKRQEGDDPIACHNGCLFSAILHNSHGNQELGIAAFYQERCLLLNEKWRISIDCPVRRAGMDGKHIGPFVAVYSETSNGETSDPVPFASVKTSIKSVRRGLFWHRRYSEFSFQFISPNGQEHCSVVEAWDAEQGHTWSLVDEKGQTLAAVKDIPDGTGQGMITYHIYLTERKNLKAGLVMSCLLMMTAGGVLPGGLRLLDVSSRQAKGSATDFSFFADAERDEWDTFSALEHQGP